MRLLYIRSLIAFAEAAKLYNWTRPVMTEEPVCRISKCVLYPSTANELPDSQTCRGRHPLSELCVDTFVPNNTSLVRLVRVGASLDRS